MKKNLSKFRFNYVSYYLLSFKSLLNFQILTKSKSVFFSRHILNELIDTERIYVNELKLIIEVIK